MNMLFNTLENSIVKTSLDEFVSKFPQDYDTIQRLSEIFSNKKDNVFTLQHLYDLAVPSTIFVFTQLLNHLVEIGVIKKIIRIESPTLGGIDDFSSIMDVPETIFDWRQDITIDVKPENIRVLYQVVSIQND